VGFVAAKCRKCLRGARISITGVYKNSLQMDMGGAILYLIPQSDGRMEVALHSENLVEGDYAAATWTGERWIVSCRRNENNCTV
jgi:hypothetical protein